MCFKKVCVWFWEPEWSSAACVHPLHALLLAWNLFLEPFSGNSAGLCLQPMPRAWCSVTAAVLPFGREELEEQRRETACSHRLQVACKHHVLYPSQRMPLLLCCS